LYVIEFENCFACFMM